MEAAGNNAGTLLAIMIIGVIIVIVSVRFGLLARLSSLFMSRPVRPGNDQNDSKGDVGISTNEDSSIREEVKTDNTGDYQQSSLLSPAQMSSAVNVGTSGGNKVNGDVAGDDNEDTHRSDLPISIRVDKTSGVSIAGSMIFIGGDIVAGDKIITIDLTESVPITCPACARGYVPADSQYACPNCGTATPKNLVQSI